MGLNTTFCRKTIFQQDAKNELVFEHFNYAHIVIWSSMMVSNLTSRIFLLFQIVLMRAIF